MAGSRIHLAKTDPELEKIFNKQGKPKPFLPTADTIGVFRKRWSAGTKRFVSSSAARKALSDAAPTWKQRDIEIPVRDGSCIEARIYIPKDLSETGAPVIVIFHGGGWCMGGLDTEEFQCRLWCKRLGVVVINVAYRLCPEYTFPTPPEDAYDSVKWISANAQSLGGNLSRGFIIGGFSGGATFAAIASHLARDEKLKPAITGVFLSIPILTDQVVDRTGKMYLIKELSRSTEEQRDAPLQNQAMTDSFAELSKAQLDSPMTCPFLFSSHENLPPVYIQACGLDPFRDAAFIYEGLLRNAGSKTKMDVYPGLPHSFWAAYPQLAATGKWVQDTVAGAMWLLEQSRQREAKL